MKSALDAVKEKVRRLQKGLGPGDQAKIDEYLDSVRDVEQRIQRTEGQTDVELSAVEQPRSVPGVFEDHAKVMFDLLALAYQCDLTRVASLMYGSEITNRTFNEIDVAEPWHFISHHQYDPARLATQTKLNVYHLRLLGHFLERLRSTPDGDGSLLDSTAVLYGSGMSDSNVHAHSNLPTIVLGGQALRIVGGRHLQYPTDTPLANLQLTLLQKLGIATDRFGDSTGNLSGV